MASRVQAADSGSGKGNNIQDYHIGLMIRNEIHMKYEIKTCCNDGSLIPHLHVKMARRMHLYNYLAMSSLDQLHIFWAR